jgi:hypothetical protein
MLPTFRELVIEGYTIVCALVDIGSDSRQRVERSSASTVLWIVDLQDWVVMEACAVYDT